MVRRCGRRSVIRPAVASSKRAKALLRLGLRKSCEGNRKGFWVVQCARKFLSRISARKDPTKTSSEWGRSQPCGCDEDLSHCKKLLLQHPGMEMENAELSRCASDNPRARGFQDGEPPHSGHSPLQATTVSTRRKTTGERRPPHPTTQTFIGPRRGRIGH